MTERRKLRSGEIACEQARSLLPELCEGALEGDLREGLEGHLALCPACARAREETAECLQLLGARTVPEPDERFWSEMRERVRARTLSSPRRFLPAVGRPAFAAALAGTALVLFLLIWWALPVDESGPRRSPYFTQLEQEARDSLDGLGADLEGDAGLVDELLEDRNSSLPSEDDLLAGLNDFQLERLAERLEDLMG